MVREASPSASPLDIRRRIATFVSGASTEITTHDAPLVPELARHLSPGCTVYVAHTPRATLDDVVDVSIALQSHGLTASPHIVARRLQSVVALQNALERWRSAGVRQALIIAGDLETPAGPFASSLDVIDLAMLREARFTRLAFAGHPEGHAAANAEQLLDALRRKQAFAQSAGIDAHIVTQFGFDAECVYRWEQQLRGRGIHLPVHAGVAGPAPLHKLLRFAVQCGVSASLQSALRNPKTVGSVVGASAINGDMIASLVHLGAGSGESRIENPHFFTFGGALASARWIRAVREGYFELTREHSIKIR